MTKAKSKKPVAKKVTKKVTPKKVMKKVTKKVTSKKTNSDAKKLANGCVRFEHGGPLMSESQQIKEFAKMLRRVLPKGYEVDTSSDHPTPKDPDVQVAEQNILGEAYEKVINDPNTAPPAEQVDPYTHASKAGCVPLTAPSTPVQRFGVLADVAVKFGCPIEAFNKLMNFMIDSKILPAGSIVAYNIEIQNFINKMRHEKNKQARLKELTDLEAQLSQAELKQMDTPTPENEEIIAALKEQVEYARKCVDNDKEDHGSFYDFSVMARSE
jgi:hypothetical protein